MDKQRANGRGQNWRKGILKYSPEQLNELCNKYFSSCDEEGRKYTRPGLILSLDISEDTFVAWCNNDDNKYTELSGVLKKAMLRMRDDLEQRSDTKSMFLLKQQCYGGYSDRPEDSRDMGIRVAVSFGDAGKVDITASDAK